MIFLSNLFDFEVPEFRSWWFGKSIDADDGASFAIGVLGNFDQRISIWSDKRYRIGTLMFSSLAKLPTDAATVEKIDPDPDPPPKKAPLSPISSGFLWSSLFSDSSGSNATSSSPTYLDDGTPVVTAPPSVILKASNTWADHILCRFLGEPPSPAKFFSDLNRIWGKFGDISVRRFSSGTFLVYVPSVGTRKWILQTGLWSSGTVSFVVSEWSVNSSLAAPPKLTSATTVLTIRDIPPQLWSQEAVACIAGGVAKLIPDTRASLPRSSLGTATIRAIVPLGSPLPPSVLVKDLNGDSVMVSVDYGKLPHLCSNCNSYGHKEHRCPVKNTSIAPTAHHSPTKAVSNVVETSTPSSEHTLPNLSLTCIGKSLDENTSIVPNPPEVHVVAEMEVDASLPLDTDLSPVNSQSPPDVSTPHDPILSTKPQIEPDQQNNTDHSPSENLTHQVSHLNAPSDDPMLAASVGLSDTSYESLTLQDDTMLSAPVVPSDTPYEPPTHQVDITDQTSPADVQSEFSFPPKQSCALNPESDSSSSPKSSNDGTQVHLELGTSLTSDRKGSRCKRKVKVDSKALLRCTPVKHCFKPKGAVEKRRKKANNDLVPSDDEVQECLLEMQSDKVNTLHFETLDAYKLLRENESGKHQVET